MLTVPDIHGLIEVRATHFKMGIPMIVQCVLRRKHER
jgi:hypothetical protein